MKPKRLFLNLGFLPHLASSMCDGPIIDSESVVDGVRPIQGVDSVRTIEDDYEILGNPFEFYELFAERPWIVDSVCTNEDEVFAQKDFDYYKRSIGGEMGSKRMIGQDVDDFFNLESPSKRKNWGESSSGSEGRIYHSLGPDLNEMHDLGQILSFFSPLAPRSLDQEHNNVSSENEGSNNHIRMPDLGHSALSTLPLFSHEGQVLDNSGSNDHIRVPGLGYGGLLALALPPIPHEVHGSLDQEDNHVSSKYVGRLHDRSNYNPPVVGSGGRWIGKLQVSSNTIGIGSNGTTVFEGWYEGRAVAVKRIILHHDHIALNEIEHLIRSDRHPNIVRYYGKEYDANFFYLALERCTCSLYDLIPPGSSNISLNYERSRSIRNDVQDVQLWSADGYPTPLLMKLMR